MVRSLGEESNDDKIVCLRRGININLLKRFNMELTFKTSEQKFNNEPAYEVEFEATSDFNLHLERRSGGRFIVYQKGIEDGEYDVVSGIGLIDHKAIIDLDFVAAIFPKWLKIVSESEPTMAVVTFNA